MSSTQSTHVKPLPAELPATVDDWRAQRQNKVDRTLNDMVEDIHLAMLAKSKSRHDDPKGYRARLYAVYDEQAVEGSIACDNYDAAEMIRSEAKRMGGAYEELADQKKATIAKALGVVLRRYGESRKERRNTVGGEVVPENSHE